MFFASASELLEKIAKKIKNNSSIRGGDETPDSGQDSTESKSKTGKESDNPTITSRGLALKDEKKNDKKTGGELPLDPTEMI